MADQIYGREWKHEYLRRQVANHLAENKDEYRFYIDGDMDIDDYIEHIRREGVWGGQLEMSILAKLHKFNVILHQIDYEDMAQEFHPWDTKDLKTVHLTYHRGRHYNSVRSKSDEGWGPATNHYIKHPLKCQNKDVEQPEEEEKKEEPPKRQDSTSRYGTGFNRYRYTWERPNREKDKYSCISTFINPVGFACSLLGVDNWYQMERAV